MEVWRFLIVGLVSVVADFVVYRSLLVVEPDWPNAWKACGFVIGTCTAFVLNKHWTFGHTRIPYRQATPRFVLVYTLTLILNVGVNALALEALPPSPVKITAAFLAAAAASALGNFAGLKWYVFRASGGSPGTPSG